VQALVIFAVMALAMPRQWFLRVCAALRIGASREWVAHQCHFLKKAAAGGTSSSEPGRRPWVTSPAPDRLRHARIRAHADPPKPRKSQKGLGGPAGPAVGPAVQALLAGRKTCRTCRRTCRPGVPRRAEDLPDLPPDLPSRQSSQGGRPAVGPAVQAILAGRKTCRRTCRPGAPRRVEDLPPRGALSHWVTESGIAGRRQWRLGFRTAATGNAEASWVQELGGGVFFVRPEGRWGNSLKGFFNLGRPPVEAPLQGTTGHRTTTWGVARLCGLRAFSTGQVTPAQSRFRSRF
jgi:hypothetical protein